MRLKSRLHEASLPPPQVAGAGKQPIAARVPNLCGTARVPVVILAILQQDVFNVRRMIDEMDNIRAEPATHYVSIKACRSSEQP
jgi:hypothetical protein